MWHENFSSLRLGEENANINGMNMKIIEYEDANNIAVKFENGYIMKTNYASFENGKIITPYNKTIFNVGFLGVGEYEASSDGKLKLVYTKWRNMLIRCYDERYKLEHPTYENCTVCQEWHDFQNFAEWFYKNYYKVDNETTDLDKDILVKGNKIYNPKTCVFVPHAINTIFRKQIRKSNNLPTGITRRNEKTYTVICGVGGNKKSLGAFTTLEEAFNIYKEFKEKTIKKIAEEYKDKIPQKLYDAMYNYRVEITD